MEVGDDPSSSSSSSSSACGGINRNNNKRKFQDEILLQGVAKHKNAKTSTNTNTTPQQPEETRFSSNNILQLPDIKLLEDLQNMRNHVMLNNNNGILLIHSPKHSNSFSQEDAADSVMSMSVSDDDSKNEQQQYLKTCPHDGYGGHSTASVNWSGMSSTRTGVKTSSTNFYPCPGFEVDEEFTTTTTTTSSGYEQTKQLETSMEDLFCSNGSNLGGGEGPVSNSFVLSSGRWDINQDTEQGTEKLTIDKEFEQYFSKLML